MTIPAHTVLVVNSTLITFLNVLGIVRWICIRKRARTRARNVSEIAALVYQLICFITLPMLAVMWRSEIKVKNENPGAPDEIILFKTATPWYQKMSFSVGLAYILEMWALKVAFLALFFDLMIHLSVVTRWLLYGTSIWTTLTLIVNLIFNFANCRPMSLIWSAKCDPSLSAAGITIVSWGNITTDIGLLAVGISIIRSLRLRGGAGTAVWCIPLIGLTTLITTSIRWGLAFSAINGGVTIQAVHVIFIFSGVEVTTAYLAFALPAARVILRSRREAKTIWTSTRSRFLRSQKSVEKNVFDATESRSFDVESKGAANSNTELRPVDHIAPV